MNLDLISVLIFYGILLILYYSFKKKFTTQGLVVMYKTKFGLKQMDYFAKKFPRIITFLSYIGVIVGFLGMAFILYFLIKATWQLIFIPGTEPALAPVLPGVQISGIPTLSFWHWIVTIFIAAVIHEFSHGIVARLHNVPIKSSGFAFLGPLLAAFVEPEEKSLEKKQRIKQMAVFAAGPFSNILFGALILVLMLAMTPVMNMVYDSNGILVNGVLEGYPVNQSGLEAPFIIESIDETQINGFEDFVNITSTLSVGDDIILGTDKGNYDIVLVSNPDNESVPFFGILNMEENLVFKENYSYLEPFSGVIEWFKMLIMWLFLISIGIGMFNLLPLGPVDGGRMFYTLMLGVLGTESRAKKALLFTSVICLGLIIINMIPWISKFFVWVWNLILFFV